jgi:hypothetical protein
MNCDRCGGEQYLACTVVMDGGVHEAWRCQVGHHHVRATGEKRLQVGCERSPLGCTVRIQCGPNCYIFDANLFRAAFREVLSFARSGTGPLILDLGTVALVAEPLLGVMGLLHHGLKQRHRELWVVTGSRIVEADLLRLDPRFEGRIVRSAKDLSTTAAAASS